MTRGRRFLSTNKLAIGLAAAATSLSAAGVALASDIDSGASAAQGTLSGSLSVTSIIGIITNVLIFFVGAISVIMLIIGGLRYVTSAGNASAVQGAKNTILYAIIGIVVAVAAYAIVSYVLGVLGA